MNALPSLKWLSTFQSVAHSGSIQISAQQTGLSISTVSHHLKCLESHVGLMLIDHSCRPMVLTAQGVVYLRYVDEIIDLLSIANNEIRSLTPKNLTRLRFAVIEDFENDIGPEITRLLSTLLPNCHFTHYTRVSHDILSMFENRELDIGVATQPQSPLPQVREFPLLRDPFVLAVPVASTATAEEFITGKSGLPFLRYMRSQFIGTQIEAQLIRMRIKLETTFEFESTASIMSLIARNSGWAITTPSNYARSKRFQSQVRLLPLPIKGFARTVSVFAAEPHLYDLTQTIASALKSQLSSQTIGPMHEAFPWLKPSFRLIKD
ncbi:MAG: LysR family transcriptional regulator [Pseudoruegeria sp.]